MRMTKGSWTYVLIFLVGGIVLWVVAPGTLVGPIWVAVSAIVILLYLIFGIKSRLAEGNVSSSGMPPQPTDAFGNTGMFGGMPTTGATGMPADMTMNVSSMNVPLTAAQSSEAGQAIMAALKEHGIDPSSGTVDLRSLPGARAAVMKAMSEHGIDVAHMVAMASPAVPIQPNQEPVERMSKLKQLHDTGLISDEEYEANKKRILGDL